jgi:hypothetical protein
MYANLCRINGENILNLQAFTNSDCVADTESDIER